MKKFEIDVDINGTITFEVEAKNKKEAQAKVDDILSNTSVKEAIKSYRNNIVLNEKVKQDKDRERGIKMAYSKRIPPIKIKLNVDEYNKLLEILENMIDSDNENYSNKSSKMKDKLLRYSVPITEEDGTTIVDMRFYNNEIVDLFMILFYEIGNIPINTNYYEVLLSVREKIKKSKMSEE